MASKKKRSNKPKSKPAGGSRISASGVHLSIVAPLFNEAEVLEQFYARTVAALQSQSLQFEILFVDDGSTDQTARILQELCARDRRVKAVHLSRNFGKDIALCAGMDHASGDLIVPIDADLQDPPELIPAMIEKLAGGYDVVCMQRAVRRGESLPRRLLAYFFYQVISFLSDISIPRNVGDFRIFNRRVLQSLNTLGERRRFMKGLFCWVGFRQTTMPYIRDARYAGKTSWNYWKLWNFALDGITSFTTGPLRVWTYIGLAMAFGAFLLALFLILRFAYYATPVSGYAALMVVILMLGGMQLVTLGILGEYIGRIFEEVKARPVYLVRATHGRLPQVRQTHRLP